MVTRTALAAHQHRRSVGQPAATPRRGVSRPVRQGMLVAHIVAAGAWIGIDVVLGVLVLTGMLTTSSSTEALAYRALGLLVWPLILAGAATLMSGLAVGLVTRYGLVRYWWVATKLALNIVLLTLVIAALRPGVADAVRHGETVAGGTTTDVAVDALAFPPVVSLVSLTVATVLSVYKPWGRIRRRRG